MNEMTPRELIAELRRHINPNYADRMGTESYERRVCAEALEAQADRLDEVLERKPVAWRYTCASGTFYTDDPRDVYDNPEVESWTALYSEEN